MLDPCLLRIEQIRREATDIFSLDLGHPDGNDVETWTPGAHVILELPSGLVRQYSLCGSPDRRNRYRVAVQREPNGRGGSIEVHTDLRVGQHLKVGGPRNNFRVPPAPGYLFVAGGIGVTPLVPMIEQAVAVGAGCRVVYGARSRDRMAFLDRLHSALPVGTLELAPEDEVGRLDCSTILRDLPAGWLVCGCGPAGLLAALEDGCRELGLSDRLYIERFDAGGSVAPFDGDAASGSGGAAGAEDVAVEVELARSGATVIVPPDSSILDAIGELCLIPSSCTEGYCGTCEVGVLDGVPLHRDTVLSDEERASNQTMMVCVSRASTPRLVLDV